MFGFWKRLKERFRRKKEEEPSPDRLFCVYNADCATAVVFVDNKNGTMFNGRRQASDKVLNERLLSDIPDTANIRMTPYTLNLFRKVRPDFEAVCDTQSEARPGDIFILEDTPLSQVAAGIDRIIICRWGLEYPSDMKLDYEPSEPEWENTACEEMKGSSHDEMVLELWERRR